MFSSHSCKLRRTLSQQIFRQLCDLWQQMAQENEQNIILLNQAFLIPHLDVLQEDLVLALPEKENPNNHFLLLVSPEFQVFLAGVAINQASFYQVTILFNTSNVSLLLNRLVQSLQDHPSVQAQLKQLQQVSPVSSNFQSQFLLQLFNFLELAASGSLNYNSFTSEQEIKTLSQEQVRKKAILQQVAEQIQNNLDELIIIEQTLPKVQNLLEVDRLLIYQVNVPIACNISDLSFEQTVDMVTYEVLKNEQIPSILYFQDETCFSELHPCRQKYMEGFQLIADDIEKTLINSPCLLNLMRFLKIKAKVVTPILVEDKLWGFLIAHHCFTQRNWQPTEVKYLAQVAEYFSVAIAQSQSYKKLAIQKEKLEQKIHNHHQELAHALVAAEVANQSKKQFLGAISHELRTPLTCIIGLSGTLIHWSANKNNPPLSFDKQQEYLQKIHDNGKKLMNLINDLLDLSQVEAGKTLLNLQFFSLHHLIAFIFHNLQTEAQQHNITLKLDFQVSNNLDQIFADQNRLQQILVHLLDNAIKFTPAGGTVIFRIWREYQYVILQIEDNGIGISENQLPLLFDKFQQLEQTRTRTHSGTGLGLALVKQLVELHQGIIEVESVVGEGSIFTVRIPQTFNLTNTNNPLIAEQIINIDAHSSQDQKPCSIVIISDDEENTTLICELLTSANYQVIWLMDGSTILDSVALLQPSVIIIDESISDFQDLAFDLKYIQSKKRYHFSLIAISHSILTQKSLEKYPFDLCLSKPIIPTEFVEKIKTITNKSY